MGVVHADCIFCLDLDISIESSTQWEPRPDDISQVQHVPSQEVKRMCMWT